MCLWHYGKWFLLITYYFLFVFSDPLFFCDSQSNSTNYCERSHPHRCEFFYEADHSLDPDPLCEADHGLILC